MVDWEGTLRLWGGILFLVVVGVTIWLVRRGDANRAAKLDAGWRQERWEALCARFGAEIAARIHRGEIWQGETEEQLAATFGPATEVDEVGAQGRICRVYKWGHLGYGRFALRVTVERGAVIGWER